MKTEDVTIVVPSFRKGAAGSAWNDLYLTLASCAYYAADAPVLVGWDGPVEPQPLVTSLRSAFHARPPGLSGSAAFTWCIEKAETERVLLLNDDAVLHPETLRLLVEDWQALANQGTKVGFLGCRSNFIAGEGNIRRGNGGQLGGVAFSSESWILPVETVFPVCALVSRKAYLDAGGFEPALHWYADNLLCFDMRKQGYRHFVSRAYVHHVGMRGTLEEAGRTMAEENERGLAWLRQHRPDYFAKR